MKVSVLMSTYNGEKFLFPQIESILRQNNVKVEIFIRDDGSNDETICLLKKIQQECPNAIIIYGQNKGFIGSFSELVNYAYLNSDSDYYAFVDQDDLWYPDKLNKACGILSDFSDESPNLFCSNSDIIDANGNKTGRFFRQYIPRYTRGNVLMFPTFQGCSMVFNRKALEIYYHHPPQIAFHDRWMYLICHFLGNIHYETTPLFGYRVHEFNALGLKKKYSFMENIKKLWQMFFTSNDSGYYVMNKEFYE